MDGCFKGYVHSRDEAERALRILFRQALEGVAS